MAILRALHTVHSPELMPAMIVRRSVNYWQSLTNSSEYSIAPTITSNREGSIVCSVNDWKTPLILSRRHRYGITTLNFRPSTFPPYVLFGEPPFNGDPFRHR